MNMKSALRVVLTTVLLVTSSNADRTCICADEHKTCRDPTDEFSCICTVPGQSISKCDYNRCCQSRRLEAMASTLAGTEDAEYIKYVKECGSHNYDGLLFVDSHFYAVAAPRAEAASKGCPFFVTHASFGPTGLGFPQKELLVWHGEAENEPPFDSEPFPIGSFALSDLTQAYESADAGTEQFDVISSNCGTYMISLSKKLGVAVDSKLVSFVTRRLVEESGKDLAAKIRSSLNYNLFFSKKDSHLRESNGSDEHLIRRLVEMRITEYDEDLRE